MKRDIVFLGTGYALALNCYNSCFVIRNNNEYFMVDAGGGNQILKLLKDTKINRISNIFEQFIFFVKLHLICHKSPFVDYSLF